MSAEGEQGKPHSGTVGQVTPSSAQRRCPRAGVFLSALTRESCHFSTAVPGPHCHTRQVKGVPVGFAPRSEQLPPCTTECLYPKLLRSSPQLAQGQARNNTKPHLQRAQARSNLAILVKERQRDLSQPVPACPSTPTLCTPQLWESRAKSPRIRSLWFLPLPSATATFHRQPRTPAPQWGPSSSHSLQVKTLGYLLNAI